MARESSNQADSAGRKEHAPSRSDPARLEQPQSLAAGDIDPATVTVDEEDEARLPEVEVADENNEAIGEGPLAIGHAAIENAVRLAPTSPGVYRMLNAANDVLYVGKAKNVR